MRQLTVGARHLPLKICRQIALKVTAQPTSAFGPDALRDSGTLSGTCGARVVTVVSRSAPTGAGPILREALEAFLSRPGKTGGGSAHRRSVFTVACSWLALNVLQFAVGGLARRH